MPFNLPTLQTTWRFETDESVIQNILWICKSMTDGILYTRHKIDGRFFKHKNEHEALIQFARVFMDVLNVCKWSFPMQNILTTCNKLLFTGI